MSRLKNFSRNLVTSYLQLGVNVIYSLASVPLILHWLPKPEFGLWAVLVQLMGYIVMIDLGINQAIARFLVDHKDQRGETNYGSLLQTSLVVSIVQGLIVLAITLLGSPWLADVMQISAEYRGTFITLLRIQGGLAAFSFCANPLMAMLYAHQRADVLSRQSIYGMILSLGLLALFLNLGSGIYSFIYASAITGVFAPCYYLWCCHRLGFLPGKGEWGRISWAQFREVFSYGRDIFLTSVGAQLINTSQIIIISSVLGLEAAAAWSVGTKIFTFVRYFVFQPYVAAVPGLYEMHSRNESARLRARFQNVVALAASLGAYLSISYALCNSLFVHLWTSGKVAWFPQYDVLLGIWLIFTSFQMTHCNFVSVTKQISGMRYLYFVEGCIFVSLSLFLGSRWGLQGILLCSLACVILFSYSYGLWRSGHYFHTGFYELAVRWVQPALKLLAIYALVALGTWFATLGLPIFWRLAVHATVAAIVGGLLFLRVGLPREMIEEVKGRLPRRAALVLGRFLSCKA